MREVVLDANLLLLLVVGSGSRNDISRHKRLTPQYGIEQFELLLELLARFQKWVTTPHVLTEADYFVRQSTGAGKERSLIAFCSLIDTGILEVHSPAKDITLQPEFEWLGLSDTGQILVAAESRTLLTNDANLHAAALKRDIKSLNFWHEWQRRTSI